MIFSPKTSLLSAVSFVLLISGQVHADELMTKAQYADYSVR